MRRNRRLMVAVEEKPIPRLPSMVPTDEIPYPYTALSTFTLQATLVSLRVSQIVHGPSPRGKEIEAALKEELSRRADAGDREAIVEVSK